MKIEYNKSLLDHNTFHIDESASEFTSIHSEEELMQILNYARQQEKEIRIIGGGSNILLTQQLSFLVVQNNLQGIEIIKETETEVQVKFMSGENWHSCVRWCIDHGYGGIENLSLIPGTIGAAPIQNIGAYGVELKDVFVSLEAIDLLTFESKILSKEACAFGYRDSIFKAVGKNKFFIKSIVLQLQKNPKFRTDYGDIKKIIAEDFGGELTLKNISDAVIKIRNSKLPDPKIIGNAGSFFKNPMLEKKQFDALQQQFPEVPNFEVENGIKIPAAWLIEQCKWKGYQLGEIGVHHQQALVLVNFGNAKGADILNLSDRIITSVQQRFNITLEREVNIW